jgi:ABC-type molybdate transport system permease subunit
MDFSPFWISLKTAITATILTVFIGTYIAYKMAFYKGPGKGIIDGLLNLPLVLPPTVVGFFLFDRKVLLFYQRHFRIKKIIQGTKIRPRIKMAMIYSCL